MGRCEDVGPSGVRSVAGGTPAPTLALPSFLGVGERYLLIEGTER